MGRDIAVAIEVEIGGEYNLFAMFPNIRRVEELFEALASKAQAWEELTSGDAETLGFFDDEAILRGTLRWIWPSDLGEILHIAGRRAGQSLNLDPHWMKFVFEFDAIVVMCGLLPEEYKPRILFGFDQ